jgi:hypothetical protein
MNKSKLLSSNFALQIVLVLGTIFSLSTDFVSQSWAMVAGLVGFVGVARIEIKQAKLPTLERLKEINYIPYLVAIIASLVEFFPLITGDVDKLKSAVESGNWVMAASALFSIVTIIIKSSKKD